MSEVRTGACNQGAWFHNCTQCPDRPAGVVKIQDSKQRAHVADRPEAQANRRTPSQKCTRARFDLRPAQLSFDPKCPIHVHVCAMPPLVSPMRALAA